MFGYVVLLEEDVEIDNLEEDVMLIGFLNIKLWWLIFSMWRINFFNMYLFLRGNDVNYVLLC